MSDSMLNILINAKDNASAVMKGLGSTMDNVKSKAQSLASSGLNQLNKGFEATAKVIKTGVVIGVTSLVVALGALGTSAIQSASDFQKQMIVLDLTAQKYGLNTQKAQELAKTLGKDLRVGTNSASESLQYLIKSGLTLDQSADLLKRFTNEAITGKSSSIDLATAVKNLAFAYTTGNSALGNMSGISENFSDIEKKGLVILQRKGELLGLTTGQLNDAQAMQARYAGMIEITNTTMGASERLIGTFGDNIEAMKARFGELSLEIGQKLLPILGVVSSAFLSFATSLDISTIINQITESFNNLLVYLQPVFDFLIQNPLILQAVFLGLATAIGTVVVGALFSMAAAALTAALPFIALGAVVGLLFAAWQTNFGGIRDVTQNVLQWIGARFSDFAEFVIFIFNSLYDYLLGNTITFVDFFAQIFLSGLGSVSINVANFLAGMLESSGNSYYTMQLITSEFWYMLSDVFNGNMTAIAQRLIKWAAVLHMIFSDAWNRIATAVSDIMTGIANGVGQKFTDMVNYVGDAVNKVIQKINEVLESEGAKAILGMFGKSAKIENIQKVVFQGMESSAAKTESKNWNEEIANMFAGMGDEAKKQGEEFKSKMNSTAQSIRDGGNAIKDTTTSWKDSFKGIANQSADLKNNVTAMIRGAGSALGNSLSQVQTGKIEGMPNIMEQAQGMLDGAKSSLAQAEQAQKAKDQADAQKSILDQQSKAIEQAKSASPASGGSGKGAKEETQAEKDLKILKAQLETMKDQANADIEALQRQKESLQYEEAKARLTEAKTVMDTTQSDALESQLKTLEAQKLTLSEIDPIDKAGRQSKDDQLEAMQRMLIAKRDEIELAKQSESQKYKEAQAVQDKANKERDLAQLEIDKQIKDRQNRLTDESRPIEQKIGNITININGVNQSKEEIAQEVSMILANQFNAA